MGLYDDLPVAKGDPAAEASAAVPSVPAALAPAVRRMAASAAKHQPRPAAAAAAAPATTAAAPAPAPPVPQQQRQNAGSGSGPGPHYAASFGPFDDDFEEYDPRHPNDFSALAARREAAAEQARLRAEAAAGAAAAAAAAADRERRIAAAAAEAAAAREREAAEEKRRRQEEEEEEEEEARREEQEAPRPRAGLGSVRQLGPSGGAVPDAERGMPLAARMMAKMGWERGKGLGKQLQGAPLPLVAKKTSARAAVVVPATEREEQRAEGEAKRPAAAAAAAAAAAGAAPAAPSSLSWPGEGDDSSRVVLLTNVAPPGLSEEALGAAEDEVGMAATASGGLRSVSVFEVDAGNPSYFSSSSSSSSFPREALVRVFVEFGDAASAARFARSVRGQPFFAGNKSRGAGGVAARPFSLGRLRQGRLAPEPGDVP